MLWYTIFIIGAVQGAFIATVIVVQQHANRRAARLLSAAVALIVFALLSEILGPFLDPGFLSLLQFLHLGTDLAFGPIGFLMLQATLCPERDFTWRTSLHFVPVFGAYVGWTIAWALADDPAAVIERGLEETYPIVLFVAFKSLVMLAYIVAMIRLLTRTLEGGREYFAGRRRISVASLRGWMFVLLVAVAVLYTTAILDHLDIEIGIPSDYLTGLFTSLLIFVVAWQLLVRPWLLSVQPGDRETNEFAEDGERVRQYLAESSAWRDPTLQLPELAARLGWNTNHASAVVNQGLDTSFYELLVGYRLDEFERLAREDREGRSVLDLAFAAGFNSKAAFYRAFRERHPVTPTKFMAENRAT